MSASATHAAIDALWRIESARLIAALARMTGDVGLAEDLAQEALLAALEQWPESGVPDRPGAWLMATAKHRGIDRLRRRTVLERKTRELGHELELRQQADQPDLDAAIDDQVGDDLLGLVFVTCHPVLSTDARVPFEVPSGKELHERLASVLEVVYLVFNEGYSATAGADWMRPALCEEALRLGRILAGLAPREPEVHGLVALMELQASRARARVRPGGEPVLLLDQERSRWDWTLVERGLAALERAERLSGALGPYTLQAAIAACHGRARTPEQTDWERIVALYDALAVLTGSPVVELNRAVALAMAFGPQAGLELVEELAEEPALKGYHLLPSVRGDLLERLGRSSEARGEFLAAAELTDNERERQLLLARAEACVSGV
jgi:predicted RNA polymerase sigma factor